MRGGLAVAALAGVVALVVATFTPIIELTVGEGVEVAADVDRSLTGLDRHSVALLLLAGVALGMLAGALARGSRAAMLGLAVLGVVALAIAVGSDVPDLDRTGPIGELYEDARAEAGAGFYAETLGGALLLFSGGGFLVLAGSGRPAGRDRRYQR